MNDPFFKDSQGGAAKKRKTLSTAAKKGSERVRRVGVCTRDI